MIACEQTSDMQITHSSSSAAAESAAEFEVTGPDEAGNLPLPGTEAGVKEFAINKILRHKKILYHKPS